ncbi:MAG: serine hydrolase domain-containing protein [Alphaproteobacteria bacterium]|nr:serine hydrolase domain-containing protein [Alphaproteobacteria bacterium]
MKRLVLKISLIVLLGVNLSSCTKTLVPKKNTMPILTNEKLPMYQSEQQSIKKVENALRESVVIEGENPQHMNLLERMAHYDAPGVSIAVINDGKLAWAKGYGAFTNSSDSKPVDTNTLFQAGSISKSLNAIGALLLVQQGKISLDEDVNQYLKSWKIPAHKFTKDGKVNLRRLLSHNAGISVHGFPGYNIDQKIPSLVEILDGKKPVVNTDPIRVITQPGKESRVAQPLFNFLLKM